MGNLVSAAGSLAAQRQYVWELERAYRRGREVWDPDYGLVNDPDVYDVIRRDPETLHAMQMRKHLVAGMRWRVAPASDEDSDRKAAAILDQLLHVLDGEGFAASRFHLAEAVFRGSAWAIVQGRHEVKKIGKTKRMWWVPTGLRPIDKRRFRQVVTEDGRIEWEMWSVARAQWEPLGDRRRWFVRVAYDETEDSLSYGRGLVESLYHWQYAKARVLAEGLAGLERWAQGVVHGKIDGLRVGSTAKDNESHAQAWLDAIENMRSRHALVGGAEDELTLLEGPGQGHEMVKDFLAYLRDGITRLILGANLPTNATSGGSYALAEVQENSTEALVKFDRDLISSSITRDLFWLLWAMNGEALRAEGVIEASRPKFEIVSQMRRDPATTASALSQLLNAGVQGLREDEVFELMGLTPATEFDRELRVVRPNDTPANGQAKGVDQEDEGRERGEVDQRRPRGAGEEGGAPGA